MFVKVVVIGAGIVGASCAYHLAERGAEVTVLERANQPATGATGKSAAGLRHQFTHPQNVKMSSHSAAAYRNFERNLGVSAGFKEVGYLFLLSAEMLPRWQQQAEMQRDLGAAVETLDLGATQAKYPYLNLEGLAGSSFGPQDGVLDPHSVTLGYLAAAKHLGAKVSLSTEVLGLARERGLWHIQTSQGKVQGDAVVNAAGAFAGQLGRLASLDVPVKPYRRNVYVSAPLPDFPHPTPLMIDMTTGVYVRSEGMRFLIGLSNEDELPGDNQAVDWVWLEHTLELALPRFPFLERVGLDQKACWAGLYAITPDHLPILGEMIEGDGFYNACGFSGHGVQHAPATGLILSEEILDGQAHSFDITDFRAERFERTGLSKESNIV